MVNIRIISEKEREKLKKEFNYDRVDDFYEGLACAEKNGKWFHIRPKGKPAYTERYSLVEFFQNGLAWVKKGDNWIRINKKGKEVSQELILCSR